MENQGGGGKVIEKQKGLFLTLEEDWVGIMNSGSDKPNFLCLRYKIKTTQPNPNQAKQKTQHRNQLTKTGFYNQKTQKNPNKKK